MTTSAARRVVAETSTDFLTTPTSTAAESTLVNVVDDVGADVTTETQDDVTTTVTTTT